MAAAKIGCYDPTPPGRRGVRGGPHPGFGASAPAHPHASTGGSSVFSLLGVLGITVILFLVVALSARLILGR
jgi:hypothetical protein